jgi:serine/threonine-protein kinase RsbT
METLIELRVPITSAQDVVAARQAGRALAKELGFDRLAVTLISTAISEVARNILEHAGHGEVLLRPRNQSARIGVNVVASDHGPGIPDIARAMQHGYSTRKGLGVGLPGAKRLMDEFHIESEVGSGTTVTMTKWLAQNG